MIDDVTLRIKFLEEDLARMRAELGAIKPTGNKPVPVPVEFPAGSIGAIKTQIASIRKEIDMLGDAKGIKAKNAEIKELEKSLTGLQGKQGAGISGGLGGVMNLGVMAGGVALFTGALANGVKMAAQLDTQVKNIGSLGVANFERFGEAALEISRRIPESAANIAQGVYQAISAGVSADEAATFVETASKAAVAGLSDTKSSVDALSSVINAYKMQAGDAERVSDMMFTAVKTGKTTFNELNQAISSVVPNAAGAEVGFDQVAAAMATMTKQGVPTNKAATQLNQVLVELQKPGADLAKFLNRAGIESGGAALKTLGLQGTLKLLGEQAQKEGKTLTQMFSSVEAGSGALLLSGKNARMAAADLDAMAASAGEMGKAFDINSKSTMNQMQLLKNNWDSLAMSFANTIGPIINTVMEMVTGALEGISKLFESTEEGMARLKKTQEADAKDKIKVAQDVLRESMRSVQVSSLAELDALVKGDKAMMEAHARKKGWLADDRNITDEWYAKVRTEMAGGSAGIRAAYSKEEAEAILAPFEKGLKQIGDTAGKTNDKVVKTGKTVKEAFDPESLGGMQEALKKLEDQLNRMKVTDPKFSTMQGAIAGLKGYMAALRDGISGIDALPIQGVTDEINALVDGLNKAQSLMQTGKFPTAKDFNLNSTEAPAFDMKDPLQSDNDRQAYLEQTISSLDKALTTSIADSIVAGIMSGRIRDVWESLWQGLSNTLSNILTQVLTDGIASAVTSALGKDWVEKAGGAIISLLSGGLLKRGVESGGGLPLMPILDIAQRTSQQINNATQAAQMVRVQTNLAAAPIRLIADGDQLTAALVFHEQNEISRTLGNI